MNILQLESVTKEFGGIKAVSDFSVTIEEGVLLGLIGPNGAGKTTIINLITGFDKPTSGKIIFCEHDITLARIYVIARLGISRTYQNIRLFKKMTVLENVLVADRESICRPLSSVVSFFQAGKTQNKIRSAVEILGEMGLGDKLFRTSGELAYGDQRRLEIARCISSKPRLLLLDEPAAGMNEEETEKLVGDILKISGRVKGLIIVEHDLTVIRRLCDRVVAIEYGRKIAEGSPSEVLSHPSVIEAYMGGA